MSVSGVFSSDQPLISNEGQPPMHTSIWLTVVTIGRGGRGGNGSNFHTGNYVYIFQRWALIRWILIAVWNGGELLYCDTYRIRECWANWLGLPRIHSLESGHNVNKINIGTNETRINHVAYYLVACNLRVFATARAEESSCTSSPRNMIIHLQK